MSDAIDLFQSADLSPFDAIRRTDDDGSEYWSARDLMPMLGYDSWRRFAESIDRAMVAATAQGFATDTLFAGAVKKSSGRPAEDFHLARFAAYLVAMNGDPRKPEVAAAQAYFAVRTREAETAGPELPHDFESALLALVEKERERKREAKARAAIESYARELEPKAEAYEAFMDADGTYSIGAVAKMVGLSQNGLFDRLRSAEILISKGAMRNTPYQRYMHHFSVKAYEYERHDGTRGTSYTSRVLPTGVDFIRRKLTLPEVSR